MRDKPNVYQVWHDDKWPGSHIRHSLGLGPEPPFPQSYIHVANVRANSLEQVWELTKDKGSMTDWELSWQPWEENREVEVLVMPCRSTSAGDVIVDPQGNEHRVKREGFDYVEASQQGNYTLQAILDVMEKTRA